MSFAPSTNCAFSGRSLRQASRVIEYEPARHERIALGERGLPIISIAPKIGWNSASLSGARSATGVGCAQIAGHSPDGVANWSVLLRAEGRRPTIRFMTQPEWQLDRAIS